MKKISMAAAMIALITMIIATVYGGEGEGTGVWPAASERQLTCEDIAGKDTRTVQLMKNEIYARHGRAFKTDWIDEYFSNMSWYKPDSKYNDTLLTKIEKDNIAFLAKCEKSLQSGKQCCRNSNEVTLNLPGVVNLKQFGRFPADAKSKLEKDGLVVLPGPDGGYEQFFHVYEDNDYRKLPSFITSDSILHTYHIFFDFSLRDVEENKLLKNVEQLTAKMLELTGQDLKGASGETVKDAARRNVAFFAVAADLLHGKIPAGIDSGAAKLADAEIKLIKAASGKSKSPINGIDVDYSMFKPRGHYTRSDKLKRFFMAMMWFGIAPFEIREDNPLPSVRAMLIAGDLYSKNGPLQLWESIYEPTAFYVGVADDITPAQIWDALGKKPPSSKEMEDAAWRSGIITKIISAHQHRIVGQTDTGPQRPQFRFMGQRYTPDGEVLQSVSHYPERPFPRGLDLMAALNVEQARAILKDTYKEGEKWPQYWQLLDKQKERLNKLSAEEWNQNLYFRWIHMLKGVNEIPGGGKAPPFMMSPAWKLKSLVTSLGSWAELRHDTILYAKPSTAECGGDEEAPPPFVRGYVEPNPKLYAELRDLVVATREGLKSRGVLTNAFIETSKSLEEMVAFLERISKKELNGEKITKQEYDDIRIYGSTLEYLTVRLMTGSSESWDMVTGQDRSVAVIADIHSSNDRVLEEAVGKVSEIYVIVPIEGKKYLTRGGVFTYYEFTQPSSERLTDEEWQKMLKQGKAPALPEWTNPFTCGQQKGEIPVTQPYSSGC